MTNEAKVVLLVEDEAFLRELLTEVLEGSGAAPSMPCMDISFEKPFRSSETPRSRFESFGQLQGVAAAARLGNFSREGWR